MKKWVYSGIIITVLLAVMHITFLQAQTGLTFRAILNRVYDRTTGQLHNTSWSGPGASASTLTETEIFNLVFDSNNNMLKTTGSGGGGGITTVVTCTGPTCADSANPLQPFYLIPVAAPSTPSSGRAPIYVDSTSLNMAVKNSNGLVNHGVQTAASQANKFVTAIGDDGAVTQVQPTKTNVGLDQVDNTSDATKNAATAILTNKQIVPRSVTCTVTANHITPNADTTDVCTNYTFSAGLTVDNPTATGGNPVDQQVLIFEFKTAAPQTLAWGTGYSTECGLPLPTGTTGDGVTYNRFMYRFSGTSTKWCLEASTKIDALRVTTLTSSVTYTCPGDTSDQCEMQMTGATGTLTIAAPTGTPVNGQRLRLGFLCTNSQTFSWNAIFISGPSATLPTTCPADTTKWTEVDVQYSTVLVKWQAILVPGGSLPGTVVQTNQSNTYTTGAQDLGAATSLVVPKAAGSAPVNDGDLRYDTTKKTVVWGQNAASTIAGTGILCSATGGDTNNSSSGSGADFAHSLSCTTPASFFRANKIMRFCNGWSVTTGSAAPTLLFKVKAGSTVVFSTAAFAVNNSKTSLGTTICVDVTAAAAPGASVNTYSVPVGAISNVTSAADTNNTAQPVALATDAQIVWTFITQWGSVGTGTTTIQQLTSHGESKN